MATEQINRQINIFIQSGDAQKVYDKLIAKEKELNKQLKETSDPTRIKKLEAELEKLSEPISRASKKLRGELAPSLREQEALVKKLGDALSHMSKGDADFSKVLNQYKQAKIELAAIQTEVKGVEAAQANVANTNPFSRIGQFAKDAFLGVTVAGALIGLKNLISGSIDEALDAEDSAARLKATLDNLGSDAFGRLNKKADELAAKFKYLDNDDVVAVFNKLIDYGKLTEKQMNNLLPVIIDFAAKQRISIEESSDVIVKALEGNAKGLKTYGINLKDVKDEGERFNVVMGTLKDKVDGAGLAFQETTKGKIAVARQEFANLKEEIGTRLLPVLNNLMDFVNKAIKGLPILGKKVSNTFEDIGTFFADGFDAAKANRQQRKEAEENAALKKEMAAEDQQLANVYFKERLDQANKLIATGKTVADQEKKRVEVLENQRKILAENTKLTNAQRLAIGQVIQELDKTTLGSADTVKPTTKGDKSKKVDQTAEDLKRLYKELAKLRADAAVEDESELSKELARERAKYDELEALAHGNKDALKQIDEAWHIEQAQIFDKYAKKSLEAEQKLSDDKKKLREKELQDGLKKGFAFVDAVGKDVASSADASNRDRKAAIEFQQLQAHGKQRLALDLQLLNEEERQALAGKNLTENEKLLIEEQYRKKREEAEANFTAAQVGQYLAYAQQLIGILDTIGNAKTAKENAELERDRKANDKKKENLDKRLKAGKISQEQYDREVEKLQKQQEKREHEIAVRQFKRSQRMQLVQAAMSGAQAIASTLAAIPGPVDILSLGVARSIQVGLIIAATAAQVAAIASQKPPQFARGGKTTGKSHAQGGMAVIDEYGNKQAEVEGDEGIINKRSMRDRSTYSVTGTPSQIASKINALHGGVHWESGATLTPAWRTAQPARMNFAAINQTYQRKYADGGTFNSAAPVDNSQQNELLAAMAVTLNNLNQQLANGITAVASIKQFNDQQKRLENIQKDATFK
jgi:hypothetical protein